MPTGLDITDKGALWQFVGNAGRSQPSAPAARRELPCVHLGAATGESVRCPTCRGHVEAKVFACAVHGACTIALSAPDRAACVNCPDRRAAPVAKVPLAALPPRPGYQFEWVSTARLVRDAAALAGLLPADCSGVVGVPRSGLIPASVIATLLHLPLYTLEGRALRRVYAESSRGGGARGGAGPLAVVDDTTFSGSAMRRTRAVVSAAYPGPAVYCAVYVNPLRPDAARCLDYYAVALPAPHLLEWNWANNGPFVGRWADVPAYGRGMAIDLDGIVVHDAHSGGRPGDPYMVPRASAARLIATGRPERDRAATEALLRRLGVRWERLEMLPDAVPLATASAAEHKARHFGPSPLGVFVESCPEQAALIHQATGKPVICPRAEKVFQ